MINPSEIFENAINHWRDNKGIGTALLKDEISKHDKIKLQVAQSNHGAMKLYKSLGFEITDRNDETIKSNDFKEKYKKIQKYDY